MEQTIFTTAQALAFLEGSDNHQPGKMAASVLIPDQPAAQYHADRAVLSCSMLKPLLVSPAHFQVAMRQYTPPSEAMQLGTAVHLMVLEPHHFARDVAVFPGIKDGRDGAYKQWATDNADRILIDEPTLRTIRTMATRIQERPYKGRALGDFLAESLREVSIYFTEPTTGVRLRVRLDALHPDLSLDLKTTRHQFAGAFIRDAVDLHYDLQAFLYSAARALWEGSTKPAPFVFAAIETDAPHSVSVVTAGETFLHNGAAKLQRCLSLYAACRQTEHWPATDEDVVAEIQPWQAFERKGI
jgi:hypothetical protein